MYPRQFEYSAPSSLDEALAELASNPGAKVMSGGMSLIPMMKLRLFSPAVVVDIGNISGLGSIEDRGDNLAIGALVRHVETANSPLVQQYAAALARAASLTGDPQVRNQGDHLWCDSACRSSCRPDSGGAGSGRNDGR